MAPHPAVFALIGALSSVAAAGFAPASARSDGGATRDAPVGGAWTAGASLSKATFQVARGDTLIALLVEAGGDADDVDGAIDALERIYDPTRLQAGQTVTAVFRTLDDGRRELAAVGVALGDADYAVASRVAEGGFVADRVDEPPGGALLGPAVPPDAPHPESGLAVRELEARRGDTLMRLAVRAGATRREADLAIRALTKLVDPTSLQIGQKLQVAFSGRGADTSLAAMSLTVADGRYVIAERRTSGGFASYRHDAPFTAPSPAIAPAGVLDIASAVDALAANGARTERMTIAQGDTIMDLVVETGATVTEAHEAARALARHFDPRRLQIGHKLHIVRTAGPAGSGFNVLGMVILDAGDDGVVLVSRLPGDGGFAGSSVSDLSQIALAAPEERAASEDVAGKAEPAVAGASRFVDFSRPLRIERLSVESGDTLMSLLLRAGAGRGQADLAIRALRPHYDLRRMQIGQEVRLAFEDRDTGGAALITVSIEIGDNLYVQADLRGDAFTGGRTTVPINPAFNTGLAAPSRPAVEEDGRTDDGAAPAGEAESRLELSARAEQIWFTARKDDTIAGLLRQITSNGREIGRIVNTLADTVDPANLEPGLELVVVTDEDGEGVHVIALSLDRPEGGVVAVVRRRDGGYAPRPASGHVDLSDFAVALAETEPGPGDAGGDILTSIEIAAGGTLMRGLLDLGVDPMQAGEAVGALRAVFDPRDIRAGQIVEVATGEGGLLGLALNPRAGERIEVARDGEGFVSRLIELPVELRLVVAAGRIETSLYQAALDGGVPPNVLAEMIRAYSFDIDFQREIRPGDGFELLYEEFVGEDGGAVRHGPPLHATMRLSGSTLPIYRFTPESGFIDYFNDRGESVRKALLRTPIDGARITSVYGMRTLGGYTRMHRGLDFGAPPGTPIVAAGDGTIERLGWNGGYGNYIRIRHNGAYKTAYAHMSGYARGLGKGSRVRQGQVVGYVGNTGNSTGPHLHYEVLVNGEQINPLDVNLPSGEILEGAELQAFYAVRDELDALFARTRGERRVASGD